MPQEPLKTGSINRIIEEAGHNGGIAVCIKPNEESVSQPKEDKPQMQKRAAVDLSPLEMAIAEISEYLSSARKKPLGKTSLTTTKRSACTDETGKEKCGVCGKELAYGDVFYALDLADFGYSKHTDKVCAFCKDSICDKVFG